ncbi:unnamed protein product [Lasius platythorax]|uniref:Uncharacterized protein n=2 Tax=Lasius TaxID=488720 RepID=A0A0J7L491_LASNI|nr:hypothetical protein RF55_1942 [Lasius niger]
MVSNLRTFEQLDFNLEVPLKGPLIVKALRLQGPVTVVVVVSSGADYSELIRAPERITFSSFNEDEKQT